VFAKDHVIRQLPLFKQFRHPAFQLFAYLLVGANARFPFAAYSGKIIPSTEILKPKLEACFADVSESESFVRIMVELFDKGGALGVGEHNLRILNIADGRYI
jgi:hypothetical protein